MQLITDADAYSTRLWAGFANEGTLPCVYAIHVMIFQNMDVFMKRWFWSIY